MSKYLVIVESPHKAKTIQKFLGSEYKVDASKGHIRDLVVGDPNFSLGVDIKDNFNPMYQVLPLKKIVVSRLKKEVEATDKDKIFLATDPDREGEAISWHIADELGLDIATTKRLEFHEITYHTIKEALQNPRTIDLNLVKSQETRRILDRIIGFQLSNLVQKKIGSKSAGRVQSVVLKLVVERQKEIDNFKETTFYKIKGHIKTPVESTNFKIYNQKDEELIFKSEAKAQEVIDKLTGKLAVVKENNIERKQRSSKPVYTTSTLQQDAANILKFNSKKTMQHAQVLYEGVDMGDGEVGLITYMRTDSIRISPAFINKAKAYIKDTYGENYVGKAKIFPAKDNIQDAHEGIRPTDISITPSMVYEHATKDEAKLYEIIYNRTLASMMQDELYDHQEVILECEGLKLKIEGNTSVFDGFTKIADKVDRIPLKDEYDIGKETKLSSLKVISDKTKGPYPYTEATLIQAMEKYGIGRPSTYATTLSNIRDHDYVEVSRNYYKPTKRGEITSAKLDEFFSSFINIEYTANMETSLDLIASGEASSVETLEKFYDDFKPLYAVAKEKMQSEVIEEDLGVCPLCGKKLVTKKSKFGKFVACSGYPECKYIQEDKLNGKPCPKCHVGKLVLRNSRFGKFYACDKYPKCDYHTSNK